jgi:DNA segregation ATPase FtsK/SpoIIIE, S-DNA-T family
MAKKNGNGTNGKVADKTKKGVFKDERVLFTLGFFTILFSIYLTIAFISYLFKWQGDQSFEWQSIFSSSSVRVDNWAGKVGASFASQFINRWFGLASFIVPFIISIAGFRFLKIRLLPLRKTIFRGIVGMVILSLILGFIFQGYGKFLGSGAGGAHGLFVTQWLNAFIGKTGTAFLLLLLASTYLFFVSDRFVVFSKRVFRIIIDFLRSLPKTFEKPEITEPENDTFDEEELDPTTLIENDIQDPQPDMLSGDAKFDDTEDEFQVKGDIEYEFVTGEQDEEITNGLPSQVSSKTKSIESEGVEIEVQRHVEEEGDISQIEEQGFYDPTLDLSSYQRPPLELLEDYKNRQSPVSDEELLNNKNKIVETLGNYNIQIARIVATVGQQ